MEVVPAKNDTSPENSDFEDDLEQLIKKKNKGELKFSCPVKINDHQISTKNSGVKPGFNFKVTKKVENESGFSNSKKRSMAKVGFKTCRSPQKPSSSLSPLLFKNYISSFLAGHKQKVEPFTLDIKQAFQDHKSKRIPMFIKDICQASSFKVPCICSSNDNCKLCVNCELSPLCFTSIIKENLVALKVKAPAQFDLTWTSNAYGHVVWKLACYSRYLNPNFTFSEQIAKYLSPQNVLYHIMKRYNKEFVQGKQSFFQRVV